MGWGIFTSLKEAASVAIDTVMTVPNTAIGIATKAYNNPADIVNNPKKVFVDTVLEKSPIARYATDGVLQFVTSKDLHTTTYGPFGGREEWMQQRKSYLGNKRINEIIFPATHDSGTFNLSLNESEDAQILVALFAMAPQTSSKIRGWAQAQYLDFNGQLDLGIRWFDLRVGVSSSNGQDIRIFHSLESNDILYAMLSPMGSWLKSHPGELIVLKVHKAMGFGNKLNKYRELIKIFETIFGDMLAPRSYFSQKKTYNDYVSSNKRCIVFFDSNKDINPDPPNSTPKWVWKASDCIGKEYDKIHEYGDLVYSPTEKPKNFGDVATFAGSSLIEYGAKAHNHEAVSILRKSNLKGTGSVVSLDFPEIPNRELLDTIIDLNS